MNRMRELIVYLSTPTKEFQAIARMWHELLELLTEVSDNLVVQLIGNMKAQFVEQMMSLDVQPQIRKPVLDELLGAFKQCLMDKDGSRAAEAVTLYCDALSTVEIEAITARQVLSARRAG